MSPADFSPVLPNTSNAVMPSFIISTAFWMPSPSSSEKVVPREDREDPNVEILLFIDSLACSTLLHEVKAPCLSPFFIAF